MQQYLLISISLLLVVRSATFIPTILKPNQRIVQRRVRKQGRHKTRRRIGRQHPFRLQAKDRHIVSRIHTQKFIGAELQRLDRGLPWRVKRDADALLPEDVNLSASILRIVGPSSEKRLHGIVC